MAEPVLRVNGPGVVGESVDGEALIVNLETGCYYSARGTAEAIWALLATGLPRVEILAALAGRFESTELEREALAFIDHLVAEGLAVEGGTAGTMSAGSPADAEPWSTPILEKFTDMQALLLLDPIHEVDATGWPQPAWTTAPADPRGLS